MTTTKMAGGDDPVIIANVAIKVSDKAERKAILEAVAEIEIEVDTATTTNTTGTTGAGITVTLVGIKEEDMCGGCAVDFEDGKLSA